MEHKVLDADVTQKTEYCIPLWLRDEQIKLACKRDIPRLKPVYKVQENPVGIACFGPSLQDTWEELKNYKTIISCSGAHRFLIDHGIIPTYHVEVDPRRHKVELLGEPHPDVTYLVASTCCPAYFDHLVGFKVILWHVLSTDTEAYRILPRGEWALTGGSNVGLRAMTIARFLGFKNQHIFGMDGNQRDELHKHAMRHPLQDGSGFDLVTYKGVEYKTTSAMLESAKQTFHELDMMPDVKATFHGQGLVQAMAEHYVKKDIPDNKGKGILGIYYPALISTQYVELSRVFHETCLSYGVGGSSHADTVLKLATALNTTIILDYGCGKGYLARGLPFPIWEYDPAIPGKEEVPRPADIVVCTSVLEHVEPDKLNAVLHDIQRCTQKVCYFVIDTVPATKNLPDGRNAHLTVQKRAWWERRLSKLFTIGTVIEQLGRLHIIAGPKAEVHTQEAKKVMANA